MYGVSSDGDKTELLMAFEERVEDMALDKAALRWEKLEFVGRLINVVTVTVSRASARAAAALSNASRGAYSR